MPTIERATGTIQWEPLVGTPQVVFVGRSAGKPVGIIELQPGAGFRVTTTGGTLIGLFATVAEAASAFDSARPPAT